MKTTIILSKEEINSLKQYCDENLAVGFVVITQKKKDRTKFTTKVQVQDLPETLQDITDINSW